MPPPWIGLGVCARTSVAQLPMCTRLPARFAWTRPQPLIRTITSDLREPRDGTSFATLVEATVMPHQERGENATVRPPAQGVSHGP